MVLFFICLFSCFGAVFLLLFIYLYCFDWFPEKSGILSQLFTKTSIIFKWLSTLKSLAFETQSETPRELTPTYWMRKRLECGGVHLPLYGSQNTYNIIIFIVVSHMSLKNHFSWLCKLDKKHFRCSKGRFNECWTSVFVNISS